MKKIIISCTAVVALCVVGCNKAPDRSGKTPVGDSVSFRPLDTTTLASGAPYYQCPMHPEVISDKPRRCPKCGMDLEKKQKK